LLSIIVLTGLSFLELLFAFGYPSPVTLLLWEKGRACLTAVRDEGMFSTFEFMG